VRSKEAQSELTFIIISSKLKLVSFLRLLPVQVIAQLHPSTRMREREREREREWELQNA